MAKPETVSVIVPGADLVDWLFTHVEGFADRRDARKYACNLLKSGYIRHTVNKLTFSEQCYYVFGDYYGGEWFQQPRSLGHDYIALVFHFGFLCCFKSNPT